MFHSNNVCMNLVSPPKIAMSLAGKLFLENMPLQKYLRTVRFLIF